MRKEASKEECKKLYDVATRIKELKPWEDFWDLDLICLREGEREDAAFVSVLGRGGECYGIVVYEGYEELNTFMMMLNRERLNLTPEFAMGNQSNLTCYWGNREELTEAEREIIKETGYKYRGRNQWLYFRSCKEGYFPYRMNQDEETENHYWGAEELPFISFNYRTLKLDDPEMREALREVPGNRYVIEMDIVYQAAKMNDKSYDRPGNMRMVVIAESRTEIIMKAQLLKPEEDQIAVLADSLIEFIGQFGAPKEIRVSNLIVEAALEDICTLTETKLRRVRRLQSIDDFINGIGERMK